LNFFGPAGLLTFNSHNMQTRNQVELTLCTGPGIHARETAPSIKVPPLTDMTNAVGTFEFTNARPAGKPTKIPPLEVQADRMLPV
jgi:hypothetical protein